MGPPAHRRDRRARRDVAGQVRAAVDEPAHIVDLIPRNGHCKPFTLASGGHLVISPTQTVTLTTDAIFTPECTGIPSAVAKSDGITPITDLKDPFHASVTPQAYATGAATVISWMLVVMLLITPRTFFVGTADGGFGLVRRRGMIGGARGGPSVIGVGSRPWLQKVAALTVAVSLTIASSDTFKVAERQYMTGFMDAQDLKEEVVGSTELKVSRVISDIFIWLAQVQTLIRLFSRHKEKVLIKWIGFGLIILDATFSCLNTFVAHPEKGSGPDRKFQDAIPALSYLFQLALSMLYAAWVVYYAISKRKYSFYHPMMWNISLVALLSIIAILTPVIFFITDISNTSVAGWGDYFRWVGAAAASVIVWEWVERIEALEREEKKDGILGREVFDGDDGPDASGAGEVTLSHLGSRRLWPKGSLGGAFSSSSHELSLSTIKNRFRLNRFRDDSANTGHSRLYFSPSATTNTSNIQRNQQTDEEAAADDTVVRPPPTAASPISRSGTATSGASTIYTVRYHTASEPSQPMFGPNSERDSVPPPESGARTGTPPNLPTDVEPEDPKDSSGWRGVSNPFKRRRALPPPEVRGGQVIDPIPFDPPSRQQPAHNYSKWDIKSRLGVFAAEQGEKLRDRTSRRQEDIDLPVTIIPAQPRGRTWSPEILHGQQGSPSNELQPSGAPDQSTGAARTPEPFDPSVVRSTASGSRGPLHQRTPSRLEPLPELPPQEPISHVSPGEASDTALGRLLQSSTGSTAPDSGVLSRSSSARSNQGRSQ